MNLPAVMQRVVQFAGDLLPGRKQARLNRDIERVEAELLQKPQIDFPLAHRFAPGVYVREILMYADTFVIGHAHRTEHFNIVLRGRALVSMDGQVEEIVGPCVFVSKPGVRKVLRILEEMVWITVHPTDETDMQRLEQLLIVKSDTFIDHKRELETLRALRLPSQGVQQ